MDIIDALTDHLDKAGGGKKVKLEDELEEM